MNDETSPPPCRNDDLVRLVEMGELSDNVRFFEGVSSGKAFLSYLDVAWLKIYYQGNLLPGRGANKWVARNQREGYKDRKYQVEWLISVLPILSSNPEAHGLEQGEISGFQINQPWPENWNAPNWLI